MSELYAILTLQLHLPPDYVMDKMEFFEIRALMKHQHFAHKDSWEQARLIAYVVAQVNSKKKLKMSDIMDFPWENDLDSNITKEAVSNEHVANLRAKAEEVAKMLGNNTFN